MRLSISHETTYHYDDQVRSSIQYLRLTPHDSERQQVLSWQLTLPRPVRAQIDPFGNILHVLSRKSRTKQSSSARAGRWKSMKPARPSTKASRHYRFCA